MGKNALTLEDGFNRLPNIKEDESKQAQPSLDYQEYDSDTERKDFEQIESLADQECLEETQDEN